MPGTYTGEPILYPLWGYSWGDYATSCAVPEPLPDWIKSDPDNLEAVLYDRDEMLHFIWMVRRLTFRVVALTSGGTTTPTSLDLNRYLYRGNYPDDNLTDRVARGIPPDPQIDEDGASGGYSRSNTTGVVGIFNNINVRYDPDYPGRYYLPAFWSQFAVASKSGSQQGSIQLNPFSLFAASDSFHRMVSISLDGVRVPINIRMRNATEGSYTESSIGSTGYQVEWIWPELQNRKVSVSVELIDVELYQQSL